MKKINIIQFMPYFPPHLGGLETVGAEIGKYWVKKDYGKFINVVFDVGQKEYINKLDKNDLIYIKDNLIGYQFDGYKVLLIPSFDLISNFPFPKFWTKKFWLILDLIKNNKSDIIFTHTRFFLSSLLGGLFAKKNKIKWVHIEHGSDYVKLNSKFKNLVAKTYDKLIGNWIFRKADVVVGISKACTNFIKNKFVDRKLEVIYRGLDIPDIKINNNLKQKFPNKIIVGFIGRLYKWKNVDGLIKAYYKLNNELRNKIQIVVVGDGEDFERLNHLNKIKSEKKRGALWDITNKIHFTGGKPFNEALELQNQFDIHFHTSSSGGGLATTLLQAMNLGCFIVSTPYEGANEVIKNGKNGILLHDDSVEELKRGLEEGINGINKKDDFALVNKKIIEDNFNWDKNIEKYYKLFNDVK